jgi:hypothetical protein
MTEWQPIETAPKDGQTILAFVRGFRSDMEIYWIGTICWDALCLGSPKPEPNWMFMPWDGGQPTHWMPLPEPPE